jgi:thioredoxin-like negative regulator of GroEL
MLLSILFLAAASAATPSECASRLEQGRNAYGVYDVEAARRLYSSATAESCAPRVAGEAATELARIVWLVDGNATAATVQLRKIVAANPEPCSAARLLGRILNASGRSAETPAALTPLLQRCAELEPKLALEIVQAQIDQAAPTAARKQLAAAPELARASLTGARQLLAIGVLSNDAETALEGWQAFYWLDDTVKPQAFGESNDAVRKTFTAALRPRASNENALALATLLIRGGFAEEAERLTKHHASRGNKADWRAVQAYLRMRERLTEVLLSHDQSWAKGGRPADEPFEAGLLQILRDATQEAGRTGEDPWPALRDLWGLMGTTGRSNGVSGLHLGHISVDQVQWIEQGQRHGEVRFLSLDNMIANGFSGWLGDGSFAPGGWAANGQIIQVRTRYVQSALDKAALASPGPARDRYVEQMKERTAGEAAFSDADAIVYLPGLADRIQLEAIDTLAAEIRSTAPEGSNFAERFSKLWYQRSFEGTILLHEGRHILDQAQYTGDRELADDELEYRAKLSELGQSTSPRVMLNSIYGRLIGGTSGHGKANERLLRKLVAWMQAHPTEVKGFDRKRPALPQLDRLSDQQLRQIARSLDSP